MEPRRPKWSPGDLNGAQEAQMETRRPKWNTRGPLSTQEHASARNSDDPPYITPPQINPSRMTQVTAQCYAMLCLSQGGPNGGREAQIESRTPKLIPGGLNGGQEAQMEPRRPK